jgi:hypothetical protein
MFLKVFSSFWTWKYIFPLQGFGENLNLVARVQQMLRLRGPQRTYIHSNRTKKRIECYFLQYRHEYLRGRVQNIMQSRDANTVTKSKEVKTENIRVFTFETKLILQVHYKKTWPKKVFEYVFKYDFLEISWLLRKQVHRLCCCYFSVISVSINGSDKAEKRSQLIVDGK